MQLCSSYRKRSVTSCTLLQTRASPGKILVNCGYCLWKLGWAPPHVLPAWVTWPANDQYQVRDTRSFHQGERLVVLLPLDHRGYTRSLSKGQLYYQYCLLITRFPSEVCTMTSPHLHPPTLMYTQLDYFHSSLVGHQHMAKGLWNSTLIPATNKTTHFNADEPFVCPDSSTLLYID